MAPENYVYYTSGRSPALSGNTLFHAVNNVWADNSGHLLEGTSNGMGVYEGNVFDNTPTVVASGFVGQLFSSESADLSQCQTYLHRACVANEYISAGSFNWDDDGFFVDFSNYNVVGAASASSIASSVPANAGNTLNT
jgi:pectin lyase